jgi:hypothetical protein
MKLEGNTASTELLEVTDPSSGHTENDSSSSLGTSTTPTSLVGTGVGTVLGYYPGRVTQQDGAGTNVTGYYISGGTGVTVVEPLTRYYESTDSTADSEKGRGIQAYHGETDKGFAGLPGVSVELGLPAGSRVLMSQEGRVFDPLARQAGDGDEDSPPDILQQEFPPPKEVRKCSRFLQLIILDATLMPRELKFILTLYSLFMFSTYEHIFFNKS